MDSKSNHEEMSETPHHSLTFGTSRLAPPIRLVDRAKEIEVAEESLQIQVNGKLELIAQQIRALKAEAQKILDAAAKDVELHNAKCQFEKKPGQKMHLYEKNGEKYFSLLSPREWGGSPPHAFIGSYVMNIDRSFSESPEEF